MDAQNIYIQVDIGNYISINPDGRNIDVTKRNPDKSCEFTVVPFGTSTIALRASNGLYLTRSSDNIIRASDQHPEASSKFAVRERDESTIMLEADNERFLTRGFADAIRIEANAIAPEHLCVLTLTSLDDTHSNACDCHNMQVGIIELASSGKPAPRVTTPAVSRVFASPKPFPDGSNVVVVPMTQTFHGPETPGLRISHVTTTGFLIRINELVSHSGDKPLSDGLHHKESIGWVAFTVEGSAPQPAPKPVT